VAPERLRCNRNSLGTWCFPVATGWARTALSARAPGGDDPVRSPTPRTSPVGRPMNKATHPQGATARAGIGFHPYALRPPSAVEDPLALVGRRVHRRMLDPHATADVAIIDGAIGKRIEGCNGPRRDGSCPGVAAGLTVPCAG